MDLRYNRVLRRGYEDGKLVYTLVLSDEGLYLIHTGNAGGLLTKQADAQLNEVVLDETTRPFVEEILANEERIKTSPPAMLAQGEHGAFIPFDQMTGMVVDTEAAEPTMVLRTRGGDYNLAFTYHRGEDVAGLQQALQTRMMESSG